MSIVELIKKSFLIFKVSEKGIEKKLLWKKEVDLTSWTNIVAYKIKSTVYGFRAIPKSFYNFTVDFLTKDGELIRIRYLPSLMEGSFLLPLRKQLFNEAIKKICNKETIIFHISDGSINLKKDIIKIERKNTISKLLISSIISIAPYRDGVKLIGKGEELLFETKKPFYNRDILIDVITQLIDKRDRG